MNLDKIICDNCISDIRICNISNCEHLLKFKQEILQEIEKVIDECDIHTVTSFLDGQNQPTIIISELKEKLGICKPK